MQINVNGQNYSRWEDVPAEVRQQLASTLPGLHLSWDIRSGARELALAFQALGAILAGIDVARRKPK